MPVAPYQRAIAQIRQRIANGTWPPGHQIPSRHRLAIELALGDGSIRRAMTIMRRSGELEGTPRSRLYVAHPPAVRTLISPDADWPGPHGDGGGQGAVPRPLTSRTASASQSAGGSNGSGSSASTRTCGRVTW